MKRSRFPFFTLSACLIFFYLPLAVMDGLKALRRKKKLPLYEG